MFVAWNDDAPTKRHQGYTKTGRTVWLYTASLPPSHYSSVAQNEKPEISRASIRAAISPVTIKIIGYLVWKTTGRRSEACLRIVVCIH